MAAILSLTTGIAYVRSVTGQLLFSDGSADAPSMASSSNSANGLWFSSGAVVINAASGPRMYISSPLIRMEGGTTFGWSSGDPVSTALDVILARDAANVLAQRNGANAQTFHLYNTYTNSTNYERIRLFWSGNEAFLGTSKSGTGVARQLGFQTDDSTRWVISSTGHFLAGTDNTYDIGTDGATRPRHIYAGTSLRTASYIHIASAGNIFAPVDGVMTLYNNAQNDFSRLQFGGTTSSFPALKRTSTQLSVRLADDSGYGTLRTGSIALGDSDVNDGLIGLVEIADPAAPSANMAKLYAKDNGSGKTQLVVRFATGAVQVIATEP